MNYTLQDTLDGSLDIGLLHIQIVADPNITATLSGITHNENDFTITFLSQPSAAEQAQCDVIVAAHSSLPAIQDKFVQKIKNHRDQRRLGNLTAEYPAGSANFFSCTIQSQDNWTKLSGLDQRNLVVYPFTVTTKDERNSYAITNSADLTNIITTISSAVLAERALAQPYIESVLAAGDEMQASAAAQPYLDM